MFLGFFIIIASVLTLLEKFSIIQANVSLGVPLALICFGASMVYDEFKKHDIHLCINAEISSINEFSLHKQV